MKSTSPELLVLCQLFYPELVSTGQTLTELCEVLDESGVQIEVLCAYPTVLDIKEPVQKYQSHGGIKIRRLWGTRFPKLNLFGRVINQLTYAFSVFFNLIFNRSKAPILVLTNPPFLAFFCAFLRKLGGRPYIYLLFDIYPDTAIRLGLLKAGGLVQKLWDFLNRFAFQNASEIVVIGRCMRNVIIKKMRKEMINKLHTVHVWSDDRLIESVPQEMNPFIEKWELKDKFVVMYSGNMGRFHDMETLIEAARRMNTYRDIVFLFVGDGHKKRWLKECVNKWRLENCRFHSYVEREDLKFSLSCADLGLVSLNQKQEGLSVPSKAYGLMAAKAPIIAVLPAKSEIAKVVTEWECGVVVQPGNVDELINVILNFFNNRQLLNIMGQNARKAIDNQYSLKEAAKAYYELINNIQA